MANCPVFSAHMRLHWSGVALALTPCAMAMHDEHGRIERTSTSPFAMDVEESPLTGPLAWKERLGRLHVPAFLVAGISVGLILIFGLTLTRSEGPAAAAPPDAIVDNVVRLHQTDIGEGCWQGTGRRTARLTVSIEVGVDGKVRYVAAAGETIPMRSCIEAHVRAWEFLPQAQPTTMTLPFEVDRR